MRYLPQLLCAAALSVASLSAFAHEYTVGSISIGHPWTRATVAAATTGAGYLTLDNTGETPDRLVGGSSPAAERVEIHLMTVTDGVMQMRPVEGGVEVPAGESVALEPGSYHLMLIGLTAPFVEGERIPLTLEFAGGGSVDVELAVEAMGAEPSHDDHAMPMGQ
jgi:copper(I)-binding protein